MRMTIAAVVAGAAILATAAPVGAQSLDERAAARQVVQARGDAVVMVTARLQVRANVNGQEQTSERQAQANATVLDAGGLTVLSLSTLQPDTLMARAMSGRGRANVHVDITSEPLEIKMHLAGGRELPAKLVLRDEDLDLAFIRPTAAPDAAWVHIDAPSAAPALLDPLLVVERTSEATGWSIAASVGMVQFILDKPRTYYQLAWPSLAESGLGSPVFDLKGNFVGVILLRNPGPRAAPALGILPADDIRDVAKQAE